MPADPAEHIATRGQPAESQERRTWPRDFATSVGDRRALLVLSALRGITPRKLLEVGLEEGTAAATLERIREGRAGSQNDQRFARGTRADDIAAAADAFGARFVGWGSPEYPPQLEHIADPPAGLFVVGDHLPDPTTAVAVVGSRGCSDLGRELATAIGRALALAGVTVVSGAARGIDSAAHEGALEAGGATLGVLGCGIDVAYPRASARLLAQIRASGTLVSEYAPGIPPEPQRFPARNRIVAGLCGAVVVVEGAEGSGSMITAEHAMEFGRDVYAVPWSVNAPLGHVPLQLIRDGAGAIRGPDDLLADLGLELTAKSVAARAALSSAEREALDALDGPTLPERVAVRLGADIGEALGVLMELELRGFVRGVGGRYESTLKGAAAGPRRR